MARQPLEDRISSWQDEMMYDQDASPEVYFASLDDKLGQSTTIYNEP